MVALGAGLGAALAAFTATFRGPRRRFWQRMFATGGVLGSFALLTSRPARSTRIRPRDVPLGALVVSHVTWDVWIFLLQPTGATEPAA
jgi:hypothetical protein